MAVTSIAAAAGSRRRLIGDAAWLFGGRIANALSILAFAALAARTLAAPAFGEYLLAFNTALVLSYLFGLGLDHASVRYVAEHLARGSVAGASGYCRLAARVLAAWLPLFWLLAGFGLLPLLAETIPDFTTFAALGPLVAGWGALLGLRLVLVGMLRGAQEVPLAVLTDGAGPQGLACLALAAALAAGAAWGATDAILLQVAASLLFAALGIVAVWRRLARHPARCRLTAAGLVGTSLPLMTTGLLTVLGNQLVLLLVGALGSPAEVALFGLAVQVANAVYLLFIVAHLLAGPIIAAARGSGDREGLALAARSLASLVAVPTLLVTGAIALAAPWLLGTVFGAFYVAASAPVVALALGRMAEIALGLSHTVMMMGGQERPQAVIRLTGVVLLPLLAWPAYRLAGLTGVSALLAASWVLQSAVAAWLVRRRFGFWPLPTFRPSLAAILAHRHRPASPA